MMDSRKSATDCNAAFNLNRHICKSEGWVEISSSAAFSLSLFSSSSTPEWISHANKNIGIQRSDTLFRREGAYYLTQGKVSTSQG